MCALRQRHMYTLGTRPGRSQPRYFVVEHSTVVEHDADAGWEIWLFECAGGCWRRWSLASSSSWVLRSGRSGGVAQDRRGTCRGGRDRGTDPSRGGRCRWRRRLLLRFHRLHLCSLARTHTRPSLLHPRPRRPCPRPSSIRPSPSSRVSPRRAPSSPRRTSSST